MLKCIKDGFNWSKSEFAIWYKCLQQIYTYLKDLDMEKLDSAYFKNIINKQLLSFL